MKVLMTRGACIAAVFLIAGCAMCGRSIPRAQVDSMKVGYTTWVEYIFDTVLGIAFLVGESRSRH